MRPYPHTKCARTHTPSAPVPKQGVHVEQVVLYRRPGQRPAVPTECARTHTLSAPVPTHRVRPYLSREYMSSRLFCIGVPVSAQRLSARRRHAADALTDLWFLTECASSSTTRRHATRSRGDDVSAATGAAASSCDRRSRSTLRTSVSGVAQFRKRLTQGLKKKF